MKYDYVRARLDTELVYYKDACEHMSSIQHTVLNTCVICRLIEVDCSLKCTECLEFGGRYGLMVVLN